MDYTLSRLGVRPRQNANLCRGARISPQAAHLLERTVESRGDGGLILDISPNLRFHELERILEDSRLLRLSLRIEPHRLCIDRPKTGKELQAELEHEFGRLHLFGMRKLRELKKLLEVEEFDGILKKCALLAVEGFRREGVGDQEFDFLMEELCRIADHDLNQKIIEELLDIKTHDLSWIAEALIHFRKAFPDELRYHKIAGDFYYKLCTVDKLSLHECAIEAYADVLRLSPQDVFYGDSKPHAVMVKKRKRGKKKKIKKKMLDSVSARLREMEKSQRRGLEKQKTELKKRIAELWGKSNFDSKEDAWALVQSIFALGAEDFRVLYSRFTDSNSERVRKLDLLRDLCLEKNRKKAANLFSSLGDEVLGQIIRGVAAGRSFTDSGSLRMIRDLLEKDEIEALDPGVAKKLFEASVNPNHPRHEFASFIIYKLIWERKFRADVVFSEYIAAWEAKKTPDFELLVEAAGSLREILSFLPLEVFKSNLASIVNYQGLHIQNFDGKVEDARAKFEEALEIDPGCALALSKMAYLSNDAGDYPAAIDYAQRILERAELKEGIFAAQEQGTPEFRATMKRIADGLVASAQTHLGFAHIQLFEKTRKFDHLKAAIENLEMAYRQNPQDEIKFNLAEAYLFNREYEKGFKMLREYIEEHPEELGMVLHVSRALWLTIVPEEVVPEKLIKLFSDHALSAVERGENHRFGPIVIDYALHLLDYGAVAEARRVCSYFAGENNRGKDSFYYAHYALALVARKEADHKKARDHLQEIINAPKIESPLYSEEISTPTSLRAHAFNLMIQLFREIAHGSGKDRARKNRFLRKGLEYFRDAQKDFPDDPILLNAAGVIYEELRNKSRAEEHYRKIIRVAPHFMDGYLNLIDLLLQRSRIHSQKRAEADVVMHDLKEAARKILEAAREDLTAIEPVGNPRFFGALLRIYTEHKYNPALDLLKMVLGADLPFSLQKPFAFALLNFREEVEKDGREPSAHERAVLTVATQFLDLDQLRM